MAGEHSYGIDRFLNVHSAASPSFSPDGARVAFVSGISGVPQVWSIAAVGGWPQQLTFSSERVGGAEFSPARDELIYTIDRGGDERMQLHLLSGDGTLDTALTWSPDVIHTFGGWSRDGNQIAYASNERHPAFFDVYVRDMQSGTARRVFEADGTHYPAGWAPNGNALLITRVHTGFINDLLLLDLESGATRQLTQAEPPAHYMAAQWRPDGSGFYCISDTGRDTAALLSFDLTTGAFTMIAAPEREVELARLSRDGSRIAYLVNNDGYSRPVIRDTASGEECELRGLPKGMITELSWAPDSSTLALVYAAPGKNPDVWLCNTSAEESRPEQLTMSSCAGLPESAFVVPELVHWTAEDGLEVPGFWYAPPAGSGPLPTLVYVHGGPEGQTRPNYNPVVAYLVYRGYGVLAPNVRGSTGYGNRYRSLDDVELRMDSVADLKAAVEWLITSGRSDSNRIAVMGGSYGGFMTLSAVTTYPELWAAGVDLFGIANWISFLENTGPWRRKLREAEYGNLEQNREFLERISPLRHADHIRAPMIVLHGANDPRVPIGEAEQIVEALRQREVPCEYVRFEDEGHGFVKLRNRIAAYTAIAEFLDRWVGAPASRRA